ncbi:MAG: hypothetical protein H7A23_18885 [Leptospiraceae bacterium]|nr:hypothetical protein [Leptospiraceae bacterium]MCP5496619.1 hypothetical protein [Leptospiraceae bacterium]
MQFTDPKNDVAFRKIFGNEIKTEILTGVNDKGWEEAYKEAGIAGQKKNWKNMNTLRCK